jgi:hypothetical protein
MNRPSEDDRSAISQAYAWATRVMVIATEMVAPGLLGLWIGSKLGVVGMILLGVLGFALGMSVAMIHLVRMTASDTDSQTPSGKKPLP